jgi:hypothetical protein
MQRERYALIQMVRCDAIEGLVWNFSTVKRSKGSTEFCGSFSTVRLTRTAFVV